MIVRPAAPIANDGLWRENFKPSDIALRLPADLTGLTFQITLKRISRRRSPVCQWFFGEWGGRVIGLVPGEIVNTGNYVQVAARVDPGTYRIEGDYITGGDAIRFIEGELCITDYFMSQLTLNPMGDI